MDAVRKVCAGLDVHQKTVVACVLQGPLENNPKAQIRTFGTTTRELLNLQDWLEEQECREVAMESTGVLWKPIWNILESTCQLTLANPQFIKSMPGHKTDVKDAQWIAELHRCGMIQPSMVASREIRNLRDKRGIGASWYRKPHPRKTVFTKFCKMPTSNSPPSYPTCLVCLVEPC